MAGVGDSRCMLGRLLGDGSITSVALTTDHTPELPAEAERIRAKGVRRCPAVHALVPLLGQASKMLAAACMRRH